MKEHFHFEDAHVYAWEVSEHCAPITLIKHKSPMVPFAIFVTEEGWHRARTAHANNQHAALWLVVSTMHLNDE